MALATFYISRDGVLNDISNSMPGRALSVAFSSGSAGEVGPLFHRFAFSATLHMFVALPLC
jgi:hypothetical protein